jgi:hypothetical protein
MTLWSVEKIRRMAGGTILYLRMHSASDGPDGAEPDGRTPFGRRVLVVVAVQVVTLVALYLFGRHFS